MHCRYWYTQFFGHSAHWSKYRAQLTEQGLIWQFVVRLSIVFVSFGLLQRYTRGIFCSTYHRASQYLSPMMFKEVWYTFGFFLANVLGRQMTPSIIRPTLGLVLYGSTHSLTYCIWILARYPNCSMVHILGHLVLGLALLWYRDAVFLPLFGASGHVRLCSVVFAPQ